jgi:hypothetical protein
MADLLYRSAAVRQMLVLTHGHLSLLHGEYSTFPHPVCQAFLRKHDGRVQTSWYRLSKPGCRDITVVTAATMAAGIAATIAARWRQIISDNTVAGMECVKCGRSPFGIAGSFLVGLLGLIRQ